VLQHQGPVNPERDGVTGWPKSCAVPLSLMMGLRGNRSPLNAKLRKIDMPILAIDDGPIILALLRAKQWLGADHEVVCVRIAAL
jgi:hypothetical protein